MPVVAKTTFGTLSKALYASGLISESGERNVRSTWTQEKVIAALKSQRAPITAGVLGPSSCLSRVGASETVTSPPAPTRSRCHLARVQPGVNRSYVASLAAADRLVRVNLPFTPAAVDSEAIGRRLPAHGQ